MRLTSLLITPQPSGHSVGSPNSASSVWDQAQDILHRWNPVLSLSQSCPPLLTQVSASMPPLIKVLPFYPLFHILVQIRVSLYSRHSAQFVIILVIFLFFKYLFIYLFMAVLGLRFCARAFSSCGKWGPLFIAVRGPLTIAASLVVEHRLQTRRLSSCGSRAQLLRSMWDLPRPGLEPVYPALAGRFSTTAPPGKPYLGYFVCM